MNELNIGKKIQDIRSGKSISIRKLAAISGLTASMISQIESGTVNPSISTLRAISTALETPLYRFFKEDADSAVVVTPDTRKTLGSKLEPSVVYELLTPNTLGDIEFCMMIVPAKSFSNQKMNSHVGEETAFFYSGEVVELEIEGVHYTLHHEDSIRIPGGAMHRWYNPTEQPVQVVFAVTPPSF